MMESSFSGNERLSFLRQKSVSSCASSSSVAYESVAPEKPILGSEGPALTVRLVYLAVSGWARTGIEVTRQVVCMELKRNQRLTLLNAFAGDVSGEDVGDHLNKRERQFVATNLQNSESEEAYISESLER